MEWSIIGWGLGGTKNEVLASVRRGGDMGKRERGHETITQIEERGIDFFRRKPVNEES